MDIPVRYKGFMYCKEELVQFIQLTPHLVDSKGINEFPRYSHRNSRF